MLFCKSSEHKNYFQIIKSIQLIIKAFSLKYCNLKVVMQNKALSASTNLSSADQIFQVSDKSVMSCHDTSNKKCTKDKSERNIRNYKFLFSCCSNSLAADTNKVFFNLESFNLHWKKKRDLFFSLFCFSSEIWVPMFRSLQIIY